MKFNLVGFRCIKPLVVMMASTAIMVPNPANSALPPTQVGKCADTFIQQTGTRSGESLTEDVVEGSGTIVNLTNGIYLVSYEDIVQLQRSRPGDKVKLCLLAIPEDCPPGDDRGRVYSLLNYRTNGYTEMPDSQHMCGGA